MLITLQPLLAQHCPDEAPEDPPELEQPIHVHVLPSNARQPIAWHFKVSSPQLPEDPPLVEPPVEPLVEPPVEPDVEPPVEPLVEPPVDPEVVPLLEVDVIIWQ